MKKAHEQNNTVQKLAHKVKLSVFCKEDEEAACIADGLLALVPFELERQKLELRKTKAQGFNEKTIIILELELEKQKHIKQFMDHLKGLLSEDQRSLIIRQRESRFDEEMHFFIRIDKPRWLEEKRARVTDGGNCYHIRITIASYPATRENGLEAVKHWLATNKQRE